MGIRTGSEQVLSRWRSRYPQENGTDRLTSVSKVAVHQQAKLATQKINGIIIINVWIWWTEWAYRGGDAWLLGTIPISMISADTRSPLVHMIPDMILSTAMNDNECLWRAKRNVAPNPPRSPPSPPTLISPGYLTWHATQRFGRERNDFSVSLNT